MSNNRIFLTMSLAACGLMNCLAGCVESNAGAMKTDPRRAAIDARAAIRQAAEAPDPSVRMHAIEAMAEVLGSRCGGTFMQNLDDPNPMIRFASAMAIGDSKYAPARERLLTMVGKGEVNKIAFIGAAYALSRLNSLPSAAGNELGKMLTDPEKEVRALAAMAMGRMGEPSAVGPMKAVLTDEQDPMVRIQLTESLAMLGDQRSSETLEAYAKWQYMDERLVAIPALAKARCRRASTVLQSLLNPKQPPQVRVAAAGALAALGEADEESLQFCVAAISHAREMLSAAYGGARQVTPADVSSLRQLAAISLGRTRRTEFVDVLHPMVFDKDGSVRVAAAMSILRLLPEASSEPTPVRKAPATRATSRPEDPQTPVAPGARKLQSVGVKNNS